MNREMLNKFLQGECTPDEKVRVNKYFEDHPGELEKYLSTDEWEHYLVNTSTSLNNNLSEDIYANVYNATIRTGKRRKIIAWSASIAAILLLFFGIRYLAIRENNIIQSQQIVESNTSNSVRQIVLPDKSVVLLHPGSEISYGVVFNNDRSIRLTGKAKFDVYKDREHPFTVYCRQLSTTALGTRFMVDGTLENPLVSLYEGKVVVANTDKKNLLVYLNPGQSAYYIESEQMFNTFTENTGLAKAATEHKINTSKTIRPAKKSIVKSSTQYLKFNNKNLAAVFNNLASRYKVEINYPSDISSINTYISVDTSQSIDVILKNISTVNHLQLKKTGERRYYISK